MALPTSGKLTLSQIQAEFGGSAPTKLSEYYAGGAYVPSGTSGTYGAVPSSGKITIRNFYGTSKARAALSYTFSSNTSNASLNVTSISGYIPGLSDITVTVNSGVYLYSTSIGTAGLTLTGGTAGDTITLVNNGYILGRGGDGAVWNENTGTVSDDTPGGPALSLGFNTTVNNTNSSAYIGGGGGAGYSLIPYSTGGGGAGGGSGGTIIFNAGTYFGGAGGSIGSAGGNGNTATGGGGGRIFPGTGGAGGYAASDNMGSPGLGGGSGGGGGIIQFFAKGSVAQASGGGGGWGASGGSGSTGFSGTGGTGGSGGSANNLGGNGVVTDPAYTYSGQAGGKAVALNGYSITWTSGNTTRVYGAVS